MVERCEPKLKKDDREWLTLMDTFKSWTEGNLRGHSHGRHFVEKIGMVDLG